MPSWFQWGRHLDSNFVMMCRLCMCDLRTFRPALRGAQQHPEHGLGPQRSGVGAARRPHLQHDVSRSKDEVSSARTPDMRKRISEARAPREDLGSNAPRTVEERICPAGIVPGMAGAPSPGITEATFCPAPSSQRTFGANCSLLQFCRPPRSSPCL